MSHEPLPKAYEFHEIEARWVQAWVENQNFRADPQASKPPFSIVIPPPNVTGQLHMGHALNNTLQDILCRYKRQRGFEVLWVPGTDHAGIATQNVVERQIAKEGLSRHDLGREKFLEKVWEWKQTYGGYIIRQLKRLGASCDWTRERFTMDEGLSRAVRLVFVQLYEEGLIYRGHRMINWCPRCMTALANIEVEGEETEGRLYHIRYPLADGFGAVTVATTRPETMLGDTAVAVHPEDPRYQHVIGKTVILPLMQRPIPVIADPYVDREFGTGALKITPGHDFNDFDIGQKHGLELKRVIGEDGIMTAEAGRYQGLDRYECRKKVVADLKKGGYLVAVQDHRHRVGHCYRCKSTVEPMLSLQWFVRTRPLADEAMAAVRDGRTRIIPEKWEKDYFQWLENIEDWCISRQIWWGHRIPAWYCADCQGVTVAVEDPAACHHCGGTQLHQDNDVLDTWFSSALWPFTTMGWPEKTPELQKFYPTSVLVTGFDILFFWVARMMMMGLHFMKDVPFRDVYVHALVRDAQGQKMSKSKGNVIDPLVMMDRYGTDALRFTLTAFAAQGRDIKLSEERIEGYRHFVNKIWNASRLVLMNIEGATLLERLPERPNRLAHRWILSRFQSVLHDVETALENYHFDQYAQSLYQFFWHEYCDWYLEVIKPDLYGEDPEAKKLAQSIAATLLKNLLILLHPVMPFVTEELYQRLSGSAQSLTEAAFPAKEPWRMDPDAERDMALLKDVITGLRNIRGEMNIAPGVRLKAVCLCAGAAEKNLLETNRQMLVDLARLNSLTVGLQEELPKPRLAAGTVSSGVEAYVILEGVLDYNSEAKRLEKEIGKIQKELEGTRKKLANEDFLRRAPAEVVAKEKEKAERLGEKLGKLKANRERVEALVREASQG
ncbi:valine--tRNA ligase [Desulfosoma caldarium]|uniref:Valine--tRNA ligase n=1 Tax=Desulfosoma caldarium TaxID=610254 RepID=A0A3N1VF91_9BACT|nr:valine--tRNA ligase [Desulfosoma caldarium]ROR01504.1 valyl-tRNA synthetase [Desulfosoma caldarium]